MPEPTTTKMQEWQKILNTVDYNFTQPNWFQLKDEQHKFMKLTYGTDYFESIAMDIINNISRCRGKIMYNINQTQNTCEQFLLVVNICNCTLDLLKINEFTQSYGYDDAMVILTRTLDMMIRIKTAYQEAINDENSHMMILDQEPFNISYERLQQYRQECNHREYTRQASVVDIISFLH